MLPPVTGTRLPQPAWTAFTREQPLDYYDVTRALMRKDVDG